MVGAVKREDSTHPHGVRQQAREAWQGPLASRYGRLGRSVGRFQLGFLPDPTHPTSIEHPPTCDCALTKGHPLLLGSCTSVSSRYQSEHPALKGFLPKDKGSDLQPHRCRGEHTDCCCLCCLWPVTGLRVPPAVIRRTITYQRSRHF